MKICIIQPEYSTDFSRADELFQKELDMLAKCDTSADIIVMPECSDMPALASTREEEVICLRKYRNRLLKEAQATARRCHAIVFVNAKSAVSSQNVLDEDFQLNLQIPEDGGGLKFRNSTFAFDTEGRIAGIYDKQHLTPGETKNELLDSSYTFEPSAPYIAVIDNIRFAFLTCYDFYFYEAVSAIARQNVDVIVGCAYQRTDTHSILETMSCFYAYNCNAYVLRSSVSLGSDSPVGGTSLIASPEGKILFNMENRVGMESAEIDLTKKYYKPAGYGNPPAAHYEYVEKGRRPWKYRPSGSAVVLPDHRMEYPRVCSHRGFNTIAPENSMPAFGAAIALGAEEIEFDLWTTKDGKVVSCHDSVLDRISDGTGRVTDHTYDELLKLDFGFRFSEKYKGLKIPTFEEILKKYARQTIMNIHLKTRGADSPFDSAGLQEVVRLIRSYDCEEYVYFMCCDAVQRQLIQLAPDITRCCSADGDAWAIVDRAIALGCKKVQLFKPYFNQEMIDKAHAHNIKCNVFWSDDPEETETFLNMGIDTVLTNDYWTISQKVAEFKK